MNSLSEIGINSSPDQSKLDSCFGNNQYIVCAMNSDETAHELSFNIIKAMFH